jgi:hypothetical protein
MGTRAPVDQTFLADLVDRRIESPDVEYKRWMPLTEKIERANIARHVCALANAGGGWLVFGFEDDGSPSEPYPDSLAAYNQDAINAIGERYLEPQPHCEVHRVTAESGRVYPVVRVPPNGAIPICAKRDGPQENGQPQGIRSGVHYIRVAGPRSVPIDSPELWRDVLRRSVLAERASLLASIGQLFDGPRATTASEPSKLAGWLDAALATWNESGPITWPVEIAENRAAFAFRLVDDQGNTPSSISLGTLDRAIREASAYSQEVAHEGAAFDAGWGTTTRAQVTLIDDSEGYELRRMPAAEDRYTLPLLWRVSVDGMGVEITAIPEDSPWVHEAVEGRGRTRAWPPGKRLTPSFQTDTLAQRIGFVRKLAENFPEATRCELAVDYLGLANRTLDDPKPGVYFSLERSSLVNARRYSVSVSIAALTAELPEVTAALLSPIFRLFDGWDIGPDYVRTRVISP